MPRICPLLWPASAEATWPRVQKYTSSGCWSAPEVGQVLSEPAGTCAQHRPGQGELAGLLFANDRVPLADLKQSLEHLEQPRAVSECGAASPLSGGPFLG